MRVSDWFLLAGVALVVLVAIDFMLEGETARLWRTVRRRLARPPHATARAPGSTLLVDEDDATAASAPVISESAADGVVQSKGEAGRSNL